MTHIIAESLKYHFYFCIYAGMFFVTLLVLKALVWLVDLVNTAMNKHLKK